MFVFSAKMFIAVAPIFTMFDSKLAHAVIMQLEHENKSEKADPEKDAAKEKKSFDDEPFLTFFEFRPVILLETNVLHNLEKSLLVQLYHPTVPTPPPNA